MRAVHLNLLNPSEIRSTSPIRFRILLPVIAGVTMAFVLGWGTLLGVQLAVVEARTKGVRATIAGKATEEAACDALKAKMLNLQCEADQYAAYLHGRERRGELLKRIASAIPEGVTLSSLVVPPQPEQNLRSPFGSQQPARQGPTQTVERAELRLTGLARREQDVFQLMSAIEGNAFTGLVTVVKVPANGASESPRVHAFRQEAPQADGSQRSVFFDIAYDIKPREFVK